MTTLARQLTGSARFVVPYALASVVWFGLMVFVLHGSVEDPVVMGALEVTGGVLYVLVSGLLLARMLRGSATRLRRINEQLEIRVRARTEELQAEIAERARTEEVLKASEQRFRDFAEASSDWIWELGPDLTFTYVSARFTEVTGVPAPGLLGKPLADLFAEETGSPSILANYLKPKRAFRDLPLHLGGPAGRRLVTLSGRPVFDGSGSFAGFRGTGADVTEESRVRAAAERMQRRHALILNAMGEGVFGFGEDGRITFINPAAETMLQVLAEDLVGQSVAEVVEELPDGWCGLQGGCDFCDTVGTGGMVTGKRFRRRDGTSFPVEYIATRLVEEGRITGVVVSFRDVSTQHRVEDELRLAKELAESATRAKSEFLAHMSHELRTPLNAIMGFSDMLLAELFGPIGNARYRDYIQDIRRSSEHLLDLINDVVDLSRIEAGKLELTEQEVDLSLVVESALGMVKQDAARQDLTVMNNVPGNLPPVLGDGRRLKQVLLNLLSNAVTFTPTGGRVSVGADMELDGGLSLKVADTGIGISPEDLPHVTDVFVQGDSAVTREQGGAGLGLPLAKHLVELHGGSLTIESTPNLGTTVTVRLPPARVGVKALAAAAAQA